jgi:hypothetical protein
MVFWYKHYFWVCHQLSASLCSGKVRKVDVLQCLFLFWYRSLEIWQLLYHTILYVHKSWRWQPFSFFFHYQNLSTKTVSYPMHYSLLFYLKLFPWHRQHSSPLVPSVFFIERARPYPQAQLYWAGRTMRWTADQTRKARKLGYMLRAS